MEHCQEKLEQVALWIDEGVSAREIASRTALIHVEYDDKGRPIETVEHKRLDALIEAAREFSKRFPSKGHAGRKWNAADAVTNSLDMLRDAPSGKRLNDDQLEQIGRAGIAVMLEAMQFGPAATRVAAASKAIDLGGYKPAEKIDARHTTQVTLNLGAGHAEEILRLSNINGQHQLLER